MYANEEISGSGSKLVQIPVKFNVPECSHELYFEGKNGGFEMTDGIMDGEKKTGWVLGRSTGRYGKVKKGQIVGYVNSLVTEERSR